MANEYPVYTAIAELLSENELITIVKTATGLNLYGDSMYPTRSEKVGAVLRKLQREGNERWVLTHVLVHTAAQDLLYDKWEKLGKTIVRAFPATLTRLPYANSYVTEITERLGEVLPTPFKTKMKKELWGRRDDLAKLVEGVIRLWALKSLHEPWLLLLLELSYSEALLTGPRDPSPTPTEVTDRIDAIAQHPAKLAELLGAESAAQLEASIKEVLSSSKRLRESAGTPDATADLIDGVQRHVRSILSQLNRQIFATAGALSFKPLMEEVPAEMEDHPGFKVLVQAMRDLTVTILARTLKHKIWQRAENQISLVGNYFDLPDDAVGIADDWFELRNRIEWLAGLDPDEPWAKQENGYASKIEDEVFKEGKLDDKIRTHFKVYRKWFKEPFKKIDDALTEDCGALRKVKDPLQVILRELTL